MKSEGSIYIKNKFHVYSTFKFPREYINQSDLLLDLTTLYLAAPNRYFEIVEYFYPEFAAEDLYYVFRPYWIYKNATYRRYDFFLLDSCVVFDYFVKNWKIAADTMYYSKGYIDGIKYVEKNYNNLNKLAWNEKIIQEII